MKKRLAVTFYDLGLGGVQRKIVDIVNYLDKLNLTEGVEVDLLLDREDGFNLLDQIQNHHVRVIHKSRWWQSSFLNHGDKIPYAVFILIKLVTGGYHSVLTFQPMPSVYVLLLKKLLFWRRLTVVVSEDSITEKWIESGFNVHQNWSSKLKNGIKKRHIRRFVTWTYPWADVVICMSRYAQAEMVKVFKLPKKNLTVVPNWTLVKAVDLRKERYDLIYCGRLALEKRLLMMLEVVKLVTVQLPKIKMVMIGDGDQSSILVKAIKTLNLNSQISMLPASTKVVEFLNKSRLFLLTSEYEGHPLVLLEAMAVGTIPVVLTYPGVSEYLVHEKTGFIEPTVEDMAERIVQLLGSHDLRSQIRANGKQAVYEKYSEENIKYYLKWLGVVK